jgi:transcriptional regulator GlxA family with amidase domain
MAHFQQTAARATVTEAPKKNAGGLSPQRERLVKQLILERLGETLEVTELAQACALSRSHFSRAFKTSTGCSPQEWIRQQRIARAKLLIQHTDLSLTQISLECGFCDQAHFCHMFTRSEGINPFAWRCKVMRDIRSSCEPAREGGHAGDIHVGSAGPLASRLAHRGSTVNTRSVPGKHSL